MKSSIVLLVIFFSLLLSAGCKKETVEPATSYPDSYPISQPTSQNKAPIVFAGSDRILKLFLNETFLIGSAYDAENNIQNYNWEEISGSNSCFIENKNASTTKISGLEKGVYQFELTVTDSTGLFGKDTIMVTIEELNANPQEIIFTDLEWIFPWYNSIEVSSFSHMISSTASFKVFIRRNGNPEWKEVTVFDPDANATLEYEYFVETRPDGAGIYNFGSLYISYYGSDVSDTPSVKIEY